MVNYSGNSTKSLHLSVEASLKKLRTPYIDILYVHWWDYTTSVEEVVNSLHVLVQQGKVLYLVRTSTSASSPRRTLCDFPSRASRILLPGWFPRRTSMPETMARHPSASTRAAGLFSIGHLSGISSLWRAPRVSHSLLGAFSPVERFAPTPRRPAAGRVVRKAVLHSAPTGNAPLSRKRCATSSKRSGRNWARRASHRVSGGTASCVSRN